MRLTKAQLGALYFLNGRQGESVDASQLAHHLDTSPHGAVRTASSLVRHQLIVRFVGGVGRQRVHFQARADVALCPHGCGPLDWQLDSWYCPHCGDEWDPEVMQP